MVISIANKVNLPDGCNEASITQKKTKIPVDVKYSAILKNQSAKSSKMHHIGTVPMSKAPVFIQPLKSHCNRMNNCRSLLILLLAMNCNCLVTSQTSSPTTSPLAVQIPSSMSPSPIMPSTVKPTDEPSLTPSLSPTTLIPSINPTETSLPTNVPTTMDPTDTYRPTETKMPSYLPSNIPTSFPSKFPTDYPTEWPSNSVVPSYGPTDTFLPSIVPTQSPKPSPAPSMDPTTTPAPTEEPSIAPTNEPTSVPSNQPSDFPTYSVLFEEKSIIDQNFIIDIDEGEVWSSWNVSEIKLFESVMAGYTLNISESDDTSRIEYNCTLLTQKPGNVPPLVINQVNYMLYWRSAYVNISGYAKAYPAFLNLHPEEVKDDLQAVGLRVKKVELAISEIPTDMPTNFPTVSYIPSGIPSLFPSDHPSERPSFLPSDFPTAIPSLSPTGFPSVISEVPSGMPSRYPSEPTANGGGATTAIVSVTVTLFALSLVGLFFFYRRRKRRKEIAFQEAAAGAAGNAAARNDQESDQLSSLKVITDPDNAKTWNNITPKSDDHAVVGMISPSDSLLSNQSLLSPGDSMGGYSVEEADGTHHLADEFDQYKDQNLEKMRADVEENLHGSDGMMSKAMTKALMADEDPVADQSDLFWGGSGDPAEIEASALCEVNDWLKRKEGANLEDRYVFFCFC